jgi:2-oxoglutarate dehydrogenase E2 component (dihydrolipoamide succinyltransferase)
VEPVRRAHQLTYLPFVARAVIDAFAVHRACNATFVDGRRVLHEAVHLGIAVDLDFEGLIVPVVHDADGMRLARLAASISDVAARARGRQLRPGEVAGGTFTITNPGPFGTYLSFPIINEPQVAILATDAVRRRVIVDRAHGGGDALAIRPTGMLSLSFDRRVVDEGDATRFLRRVADLVETRDWAAELT